MNSIEINLETYSKELLMALIVYAHERDLTFNEAFVSLIKLTLDSKEI